MNPKTAWRINTWLNVNGSVIFYCVLTIAIAFQQFPATEPLTFGFWWITVISHLAGIAVAGIWYYDTNPASLVIELFFFLAGIALQVYLVVFHWEFLCKADLFLKSFRFGTLATMLGYSNLLDAPLWLHLIPGWLVWGYCTQYGIRQVLKNGYVIRRVGTRPW